MQTSPTTTTYPPFLKDILEKNFEKFKSKYRTLSNRLQGYDYSKNGAYFITICCKNRICLFGEIENETMILNELGKVADFEWKNTSNIRPNIFIDAYVVMPNHIHGIIFIDDQMTSSTKRTGINPILVETNCNLSLQEQHGTSQTIGSIVRGFKIGVTKYARNNTDIFDVWQANYYDHIIRNEKELERIRAYILQNPSHWNSDSNHAENIYF